VFTTNMYLEESFPTSAPASVILFRHFRCVCTKKKPVVSKDYMSSSTLTSPVWYFEKKNCIGDFFWHLMILWYSFEVHRPN